MLYHSATTKKKKQFLASTPRHSTPRASLKSKIIPRKSSQPSHSSAYIASESFRAAAAWLGAALELPKIGDG